MLIIVSKEIKAGSCISYFDINGSNIYKSNIYGSRYICLMGVSPVVNLFQFIPQFIFHGFILNFSFYHNHIQRIAAHKIA